MGTSYTGILLPVERIESLYASRDEALFARMLDPQDHHARHLMGLEGSEHTKRERRSALEQILLGTACDDGRPSHFAYVIEAVCFELGTLVDELNRFYEKQAYALLARHPELEDELLERHVDIFLPLPIRETEGSPLMGWARRSEQLARRDRLASFAASLEAFRPDGEEEEEQVSLCRIYIERAKGFYEAALSADTDLFLFCH